MFFATPPEEGPENGLVAWALGDSAKTIVGDKICGGVLGVCVAWMETIIVVVQFTAAVLISVLLRSGFWMLLGLLCRVVDLDLSPCAIGIVELAGAVFDACVVAAVLLWCFAAYFQTSVRQLLRRLGMHKPRLSTLGQFVLAYHVFGFVSMVVLQQINERWLFSGRNFQADPAAVGHCYGVDLARTAEMLVLSPLKEELMFRGIIFHIYYNRINNAAVAATFTNVVFGLVHMINAVSSRYALSYIALQIALGVLVGVFYSSRVLVTGCLWESIILHMTNNLCSSFLPVNDQINLKDPMILFPMMQTFFSYVVLLGLSIRQFKLRRAARHAQQAEVMAAKLALEAAAIAALPAKAHYDVPDSPRAPPSPSRFSPAPAPLPEDGAGELRHRAAVAQVGLD